MLSQSLAQIVFRMGASWHKLNVGKMEIMLMGLRKHFQELAKIYDHFFNSVNMFVWPLLKTVPNL